MSHRSKKRGPSVLAAAAGLARLATKKKKEDIVMPSKEMMHLILDKIVLEINAVKASDGVSKGKESEIIEKHKKTMPWIDRNRINYFWRKCLKGDDTNFITPPMGVSFVPPELQQPATILEEHPLPDIAPAADEEQQDDLQDVLIKKKMKALGTNIPQIDQLTL